MTEEKSPNLQVIANICAPCVCPIRVTPNCDLVKIRSILKMLRVYSCDCFCNLIVQLSSVNVLEDNVVP